jgi:hypothetical protein
MSRCIITGCTFVNGTRWVGGDLHEVGDCYAFHAIVRGQGEIAWHFKEEPFYTKRIGVIDGATFFEQGGVIVIEKRNCVLNPEALEYIR